MNMRERIERLLAWMREGIYERDDAVALSLLAALAGESVFLLGLPGVGKSMVARRLKTAFEGARAFEYLMSRFSTPDEIFGPVSISRLKDEDRYERMTAGYLPEAEIVFLDEIWKAGPAIQNSLLTVLNEKIYLNGNREMRLPVKGIIAASNELPAEGEGLEALWDRFLLRLVVRPIEGKENFFRLLTEDVAPEPASRSAAEPPLSEKECADIRAEAKRVRVEPLHLEILYAIRKRLDDKVKEPDMLTGEPDPANKRYYVSDRRWKKSLEVMRMSACLNGRVQTDLSDLMLLEHMLWSDGKLIRQTRKIIAEEAVGAAFREYLEDKKSDRRHASVKEDEESAPRIELFTPDKVHYVIDCDGAPLKIAIRDYNRMKREPSKTYSAIETLDERLVVRPKGEFTVRFVRDGFLCINSFNYPLRTLRDRELGAEFIDEAAGSVDDISARIQRELERNLFMTGSMMKPVVQRAVNAVRKKLSTVPPRSRAAGHSDFN